MHSQSNMTDDLTDHDIARLYSNLKLIDNSLNELNKADIFNKADKAKNAILETRQMLSNIAMTLHKIKNDQERIKTALTAIQYSKQ